MYLFINLYINVKYIFFVRDSSEIYETNIRFLNDKLVSTIRLFFSLCSFQDLKDNF